MPRDALSSGVEFKRLLTNASTFARELDSIVFVVGDPHARRELETLRRPVIDLTESGNLRVENTLVGVENRITRGEHRRINGFAVLLSNS
jgi:hypothetical protein